MFFLPANESQATLYEDDGESMAYQKGQFLKRSFSQKRTDKQLEVVVSPTDGDFEPASRDLTQLVYFQKPVRQVTWNDTVLPPAETTTAGEAAWQRIDPHFLQISFPDTWSTFRVIVEEE